MRLRRRPPRPPSRSDLTDTAGRMFSPDCWANQPVCGRADPAATRRFGYGTAVHVMTGPRVLHVTGAARDVYLTVTTDDDDHVVRAHQARIPFGLPPRGDLVIVDHVARTVVSARDWHDDGTGTRFTVRGLDVVDLDGDGWGSPALGLPLERELLGGDVPHAVGLWAPHELELYGCRVQLVGERPAGTPAEKTLADALARYGGIVVGAHGPLDNGPWGRIAIRVEQSSAATPSDPIGPLYRQLGIGSDSWLLPLDVDDFEVLI